MKRTALLLAETTTLLLVLFSLSFENSHTGNTDLHIKSGEFSHRDTSRLKSYELYFQSLAFKEPFLMFPAPRSNSFTSSLFNNINVSQNTFPQNEPSVKISRKNPQFVVAAWRDFRTGVTPPVRRVGFSRSTDTGLTWSASALLPSIDTVTPLASDPAVCTDTAGNFFISTLTLSRQRDNGRVIVYKSTNNGSSFEYSYNIAPPPDTMISYEDKDYITCDLVPGSPYRNNIYVTWVGYSGNTVVRSSNSGLNWSERVLLPRYIGCDDLEAGINGVLYIIGKDFDSTGTKLGFYITKSSNGGQNFSQPVLIDSLPLGGIVIRLGTIATDITNGPRRGYVYAVWSCTPDYNANSEDEDIYFSFSSNEGASWSPRKRVNNDPENNGKKQYYPWVTCSENGNIYIVFYDTRNTPNNNTIEAYLASSTDGGLTFRNDLLSTQQSPVNVPNYDVRFGDYIGIDSWGGKVVPVWTDERAGDFDMEIYTATIKDSVIGINPVSSNIPVTYHLYQNFPNPFNPSTKIRFDIAKSVSWGLRASQRVKLQIYDVLGREKAVLVDENLMPGSYEVVWNAAEQPSGIYFCRLTAGDLNMVMKMIVLK